MGTRVLGLGLESYTSGLGLGLDSRHAGLGLDSDSRKRGLVATLSSTTIRTILVLLLYAFILGKINFLFDIIIIIAYGSPDGQFYNSSQLQCEVLCIAFLAWSLFPVKWRGQKDSKSAANIVYLYT